MHMWFYHDFTGRDRFGEVSVAGECGIRGAAAIMTAFFAYALVTVQGPQPLLDRVGVFYTVSLDGLAASFALEVLFSLFYSLAVRGVCV